MKKYMKILPVILATVIFLTGCNILNENEQPKEMKEATVAAIKGPSSMGMIRMIQEINSLSEHVNLSFDIVNSPDVAASGIVSGNYDLAAVPTNMAPILYQRMQGDIQILAVNTLGTLFIIARESANIQSLEDLKGKTIASSGLGAVPQIVLEYILKQNGIDPIQDMKIEYKSEHSEVATLFATEQVDIVMLPQPFVTVVLQNNEDAKIAVDLTKEWEKITDGISLPMGCVIARSEFVANYPDETETFLQLYEENLTWAVAHYDEVAPAIVALDILPNVEIAKQAMQQSNIVFYSAQESKEMLNAFFSILYESNPSSIGGSLPGDDIYYKQ